MAYNVLNRISYRYRIFPKIDTQMDTMIWVVLLMIVIFTNTEAYSTNTIGNILKHLSDCKFNSIKVQNGDLETSKAAMKNGLFLASKTESVSLLTLDENLPMHNQSYYSKFKICQNVLVTNTDTEKLANILSKSNISVNAGIFRYALDNFGNVNQWVEFYKTRSTSKSLQINTIYFSNGQSDLDQEKYIWKRRSNLHGINFEAISA